ncbi:TetR/AcrR family transcriptional regulator [Actinoallomurus spadix]|uniref:TetR/AcrR family transcriptional regulator n=1 Tax=Actinoallomurus spadix TaxID=79912 RepID=A0ABN0VUV1_9ACTN|nr:TetR/AcrR family transcriptional regulator [Actinoallomurus spadix]MCO5985754.1 TetR/AcrR family transcriptional regulator [Actinoallomurus spadix]
MAPRRAAALRGGGGEQSLRAHLIVTAERLIAERGTAGLTVRAIARAAGVADGVLYNHFADKEELLAHALRARVRAVERGLGELPEPGSGTIEGNLRTYLAHGLDLHRAILPAFAGLLAQPEVLARFADLTRPDDDWRDRLIDYLRAERDLGRLAPQAPVEPAVRMMVGVCHEAILSLLLRRSEDPDAAPVPQDEIDAVVTAVLRGIGR